MAHSTTSTNASLNHNERSQESLSMEQTTRFNFCTLTGEAYALKVLALYESLAKECSRFNLWICCLDDLTYSLFKKFNLQHVHLLKVEEIEDDRLREVKTYRKQNEYCWTLKAPLVEYILTHYDLEQLCYCDGDLYFFSDPAPLFTEWGDASIFLCPQRDLEWVEEKYGKYQAGFIGFRNDEEGLRGLRWWKERCLDWCFAFESHGRYGDQKYLDPLPHSLQKVKISEHLGVNAAPWNCVYHDDYEISMKKNEVFIEDHPLIFFHFACLTIYNRETYDLWSLGSLTIDKTIINLIYIPYLDRLRSLMSTLEMKDPLNKENYVNHNDPSEAATIYRYTPLRREIDQEEHFINVATIMSKDYLVKGVALHDSLLSHADAFHLWICCTDIISYIILTQLHLPHTTLIRAETIEDEQLKTIKRKRTMKEYCWTLKAPLCLFLLENYLELDSLIYCDADLYFFSNPTPLLQQWGKYSIFMCRQRGTSELEDIYGHYQAGLLGFRNDQNNREILKWWKDQCLFLCSANLNESYGTYGDQKYLDQVPHLFSNIKIIENIGINAAPWNHMMNHHYTVTNQNNTVYLDQCPLIAYHFGSLRMLSERQFDLWKHDPLSIDTETLSHIYLPYLHKLHDTYLNIKKHTQYSNLISPSSSNKRVMNPCNI